MAVKPVCKRCEQPHWNLVPCAEVGIANEMEQQAAEKRARLTVVPVYRSGKDREPKDNLRTLVQQAPGVFVRNRPDAA